MAEDIPNLKEFVQEKKDKQQEINFQRRLMEFEFKEKERRLREELKRNSKYSKKDNKLKEPMKLLKEYQKGQENAKKFKKEFKEYQKKYYPTKEQRAVRILSRIKMNLALAKRNYALSPNAKRAQVLKNYSMLLKQQDATKQRLMLLMKQRQVPKTLMRNAQFVMPYDVVQEDINSAFNADIGTNESLFGTESWFGDEQFYTENYYGTEFDDDVFSHLGIDLRRGRVSPLLY